MNELYATLKAGKRTNQRGWTAIPCPDCDEHRQFKSAFTPTGFHCFHCGAKYPLTVLAQRLSVPVPKNGYHRPARAPKPPTPRYWHRAPGEWARRSLAHLGRVEMWQKYRPFTLETIQRYRLGVSVVPATPCQHQRLTYVYDDLANKRPTLRGRIATCRCDKKALKWVTAGGGSAALWGAELLRPGFPVLLCESPVDAMLAMQTDQNITAIAGTAGAGTWRKEWTRAISSASPAILLLAYDNDLQGQATGAVRGELARKWLSNPAHKRLPVANGPKVANHLIRAGVLTRLFDWRNSPPRDDLSALLMRLIKASNGRPVIEKHGLLIDYLTDLRGCSAAQQESE